MDYRLPKSTKVHCNVNDDILDFGLLIHQKH